MSSRKSCVPPTSSNMFKKPIVKEVSSKIDNSKIVRASSIKKRNQTINNVGLNVTFSGGLTDEIKEADDLAKKLSYNDYLEAYFLESLVDEKIQREKTEIDIKMAELAKRLEINKVILRKTQDRLKDISFLSEEQRILNGQKLSTDFLLEHTDEIKTEDALEDFQSKQDAYCDRLLTKNINLGVTKDRAYAELHSAITQATNSLEAVKRECNFNNDEIEALSDISEQLKKCDIAEKDIQHNLEEYKKISPQVESNVLEAASLGLASTIVEA